MTTNRTDNVLFFPTKYHAQRNTRFSHSASVCLFFSNDTFFQNFSPVSHMILISMDTHEKEFRAIHRTR